MYPKKSMPSVASKEQGKSSGELFTLGDKEVQSKALGSLDRCRSLPKKAWWRLEEVTYVDVALFTQATLIFVQCKPAAIARSKEPLCYRQRSYIHRILDCAAAYAREKQLQDYFLIEVVDKDLMKQNPVQDDFERVMSPQAISVGFPHLTEVEGQEIMMHYGRIRIREDMIQPFDLGAKRRCDEIDSSTGSR